MDQRFKENLEKYNLEIEKQIKMQSQCDLQTEEYRNSLEQELKFLNKKKRVLFKKLAEVKSRADSVKSKLNDSEGFDCIEN